MILDEAAKYVYDLKLKNEELLLGNEDDVKGMTYFS